MESESSNIESIHYLAIWHLERQSFHQARKYFTHLANSLSSDSQIWLSLAVCCAMGNQLSDCRFAISKAESLVGTTTHDARFYFCEGLLHEKGKQYELANEKYINCIQICDLKALSKSTGNHISNYPNSNQFGTFSDLKGDAQLRMAIILKDTGKLDEAMNTCVGVAVEPYNVILRANALCLKGLIHELKMEFPTAEIVYRSALQLLPGHTLVLERLGRVYLRYRETIPAAVQCFIKSVEVDPSGYMAWYLLGRCYMATAQYTDAWEAYNRAINLNPNDHIVWCSLGVLYYSFGQYREALGMFCRAIKLEPTMPEAWYNVGALYDMLDQTEDAQKAYIKAKESGLSDHFLKSSRLKIQHVYCNKIPMNSAYSVPLRSSVDNANISYSEVPVFETERSPLNPLPSYPIQMSINQLDTELGNSDSYNANFDSNFQIKEFGVSSESHR